MRIGLMVGPERGRYGTKVERMRADARWAEEAGPRLDLDPADPRRVRRPHRRHRASAPRPPASRSAPRSCPSRPRHPIALAQQALSTQAVLRGPARPRPRRVAPLGRRRDARPPLRATRWPSCGPTSTCSTRRLAGDRARSTWRTTSSASTTRSTSPTSRPPRCCSPPSARRCCGSPASAPTARSSGWPTSGRSSRHIVPTIDQGRRGAPGGRRPRIVAGVPVCLCGDDEVDVAVARANRVLSEAEVSPNYQRLLDHGDATQRRRHPRRRQRGERREAAALLRRRRRHRPVGPRRARSATTATSSSPRCAAPATTSHPSPARSEPAVLTQEDPMTAPTLDIPVFDADNHLYETARLAHQVPARPLQERRSTTSRCGAARRSSCAGTISEYIPNPTFEVVARPGRQEDYFRKGNPEGKSRREIFGEPMRVDPGVPGAGARACELMDEQGIDRALMFPTLASLIEERMRDDPDMCHAVIHSLNEWIHETWTFNYEDRIFATPVHHPARSSTRPSRSWSGCVERGAKAVLIRPAPAWGYRGPRSPGLAGVRPVLGEGRGARHPRRHALVRQRLRALRQRVDGQRQRDAAVPAPGVPDAVASGGRSRTPSSALICHGALSRFPTLKVAVIENGSSWVEPLLEAPGRHLQEDAAGLPRGPGRGLQAQHLHQPVLGGGPRRPRRAHRRRARAVRLRLPAPRGPRPTRPATSTSSRARPRTSSARSWAATWPG